MPQRLLANKSPTATAPAAVAWSLGNEKSVVLSTRTCTSVIVSYGRSRIDRTPDELTDAECHQRGCPGPHAGHNGSEVIVLAAVEAGHEEQDGEQGDAVAGVGLEQAVGPARPVGESVDPAVQAAVHSVVSNGDRRGRWGEAGEDPSFGGPRLDKCLRWHSPGAISQGERDHDDVIEWADDRQELGDQIDRRQHPHSGNGDGELDARRAEWGEFVSECGKCLVELDKEIRNERFTLAELDEEEQNVDRLRRWHRELRSRDVFDSVEVDAIQSELDACAAALERFTGLVYQAVGLV